MCFLLANYQPDQRFPLIVGSNRDEFYRRGGLPPKIQEGSRYSYYAPKDPRAGGTWIGQNEAGLFAGLTNQPGSGSRSEAPSRGLIVQQLLGGAGTIDQAEKVLSDLEPERFNPFTLVVVAPDGAFRVARREQKLELNRLEAGPFLLSDRNGFELINGFSGGFPWEQYSTPRPILSGLKQICQMHTLYAGLKPCRHGSVAGTVSSFVLVMDRRDSRTVTEFSQGPPCRSRYQTRGFSMEDGKGLSLPG